MTVHIAYCNDMVLGVYDTKKKAVARLKKYRDEYPPKTFTRSKTDYSSWYIRGVRLYVESHEVQ